MELKQQIKEYWNDKQPNLWYGKDYGEIEHKKYNEYYPYLPLVCEFDNYKGKNVLEIGVGMGIDLKQYAQNGAICYGTDLTEGSINKTKHLFETYNLKANLQVMDAENLKFEDNTFDMVCSYGVLHHTPDTQKAIDEIHRVLKPNGKVIIILYSRTWKHYLRRVLLAGIIQRDLFKLGMQELVNKYSEAYGNSPLTKLYSKRHINIMFTKFRDVKISHWHYRIKHPQGLRQTLGSIKDRKGWKFMQGNWLIKGYK